jgi:AraC-like DNA-binding protein
MQLGFQITEDRRLVGLRTKRRSHADATVRISGLVALPEVLATLGADPATVLAEAGVDPTLFDDPENLIPLAQLGRLVRLCVARTGCRHFGLLVGQQGGLHSLGLAGLFARLSPDVATALRRLADCMHLHHGGTLTAVAADGDAATLSYDIDQRYEEAADQIGDGALATLFNMLRTLCGPGWRPIEIRFAHRAPDDVRPFRAFFAAELRFDAGQNAIVFPGAWLQHPLPADDAELQRLLARRIALLEARHGDEFPEQVRSVLRAALITGHAGADEVAALFSMHSRTMNRRLGAFGSSFRNLVDEGRFAMAREMLRGAALDVSAIAGALGYADASAFTRAFRRWSGTTPAAWRKHRTEGLRKPAAANAPDHRLEAKRSPVDL